MMLERTSSLNDYFIRATDGQIGKIVDLLFDDDKWSVRWLVVDTGNWLSGRRVLLASSHLGQVDRSERQVLVQLSRDQVKGSPDVDTSRPVSRQAEASIYDYYNWSPYWSSMGAYGTPVVAGVAGIAPLYPAPGAVADGVTKARRTELEAGRREEDPHLRSASEVTGYYIEASDGAIGHVEDFLIDDDDWSIRYAIVDTKNWWPGKFVLIAPDWIEAISWSDGTMRVRRTREEIRNAPEYDPSQPVQRDYESRLYGYYSFPPYWG